MSPNGRSDSAQNEARVERVTEQNNQFLTFYRQAFGDDSLVPFAFQQELADRPVMNSIIPVPTGSGKTAAALLGWLWQLQHNPKTTPRRLVYCLPMRTLVEQTHREVQRWLANLFNAGSLQGNLARLVRGGAERSFGGCTTAAEGNPSNPGHCFAVYRLMGGEVEEDWEWSPELPSILIGTADMLLSRALNRGYAMSRYRWPVHFALLNNDCLWVIDEVQLFGSGLSTTTQLQALRETWSTYGPTATWWMSATIDTKALETVDARSMIGRSQMLTLGVNDLDSPLGQRYRAAKPVEELSALNAKTILKHHRPGTLTLVVVNTVRRAQEIYSALKAEQTSASKRGRKPASHPSLVLFHSRFRQPERRRHHAELERAAQHPGEYGTIVVATQVVEAGLDISAVTLITQLAPWASLVQRFGRCNRRGEFDASARILWAEVKGKDAAAPYEEKELALARGLLRKIPDANASPQALGEITRTEEAELHRKPLRVIRKHDLLSLFSTDPDLAGGFTDVSRFVRDVEREADVYVYWRGFANNTPGEQARAQRDELCAVPVWQLQEMLRNSRHAAWEWNGERDGWERRWAAEIRPGMMLLLPLAAGGYDSDLGWTGDANRIPALVAKQSVKTTPDSQDNDEGSERGWVALPAHLNHVHATCKALLLDCGLLPDELRCEVERAARWHDVGKAVDRWQKQIAAPNGGGPWAKFPKQCKQPKSAPHFRHEAASALAAWSKWLQGNHEWTALAVYLVAAHHGKVRTVLRSRSGTKQTPNHGVDGNDIFGVREDDTLKLAGYIDEPLKFDLSPRFVSAGGILDESGGSFVLTAPAWVEVVADLLGSEPLGHVLDEREPQNPGPFRLAMLEALLRAADAQASKQEEQEKRSLCKND